MLSYLAIRDLAVVQTLDLDFEAGLTVLTGETGAGKSILLTALALALGDRADPGLIRPGASRAEINLGFDVSDCPLARQWLEDNDLADDAECLIRRVIGQDGRSKAYINSRQVTLQALQELGPGLLEIHGQHAHVKLVKNVEQRRLLDEAADNGRLVAAVSEQYREWRAIEDELRKLESAAKDRAARQELLRYQLDELDQHDIPSLDYAALVEEHGFQANIGKITGTGQSELDRLYEDESHSVNSQLAQAIHALADLSHVTADFEGCVNLLKEAQIQVKEAASEIRRRLDRLEDDPRRLDWLEDRLGLVHGLARKHQVRPEDLRDHCDTLRAELSEAVQGFERVQALTDQLAQIFAAYQKNAGELSRRRKAAATALGRRVSGIIHHLGMAQGDFTVSVSEQAVDKPAPQGWDNVEFLVSANPGLPPRPLGKVASGGELSRISLAIQVAVTDSKPAGTLIFDEVDSGIGGGIAEVVGQNLRVLGESGRQVLCITHLPQVAVQGHQHFLVKKSTQGGSTHSAVQPLNADERTHEIARMLGGVRVTQQTLAHARELLSLSSGEPIDSKL